MGYFGGCGQCVTLLCRATKGMMDIMEEKTRRGKERGVVSTSGGGGAEEEVEGGAGKKKAWSQDPATGQPMIQPR